MNWFNNSKLFDLAKQGQRLPHIAAVIPLTIIFSVAAQFGAIPVAVVLMVKNGFSENVFSFEGASALEAGFWQALLLISSFVLVYFILWVWLKFVEKRPFWTLGYELQNAVKQYARGFLFGMRSEEHTSELQSQSNLVC